MAPLVYLAGPDVFLADAIDVGAAKKAICAEHGLEGVFPLDLEADVDGLEPNEVGLTYFRICLRLMSRSDAAIANMTPWRGPSMDVGTAIEMGWFLGQGRPVFGYTNHAHDFIGRVTADGHDIEDFGLVDNLMTEGTVRTTAGVPVVRHDAAPEQLWHDLTGFEQVVQLAAAKLLA